MKIIKHSLLWPSILQKHSKKTFISTKENLISAVAENYCYNYYIIIVTQAQASSIK